MAMLGTALCLVPKTAYRGQPPKGNSEEKKARKNNGVKAFIVIKLQKN